MTQQTAAVEHDNDQRPKLRGRPWQPGESGNPSGRSRGKRYYELLGAIEGDLGGEAALSGIERVICGQAVAMLIRSERSKDDTHAVRLANASARLLASLRNTRRKREPQRRPLQAYLDGEPSA